MEWAALKKVTQSVEIMRLKPGEEMEWSSVVNDGRLLILIEGDVKVSSQDDAGDTEEVTLSDSWYKVYGEEHIMNEGRKFDPIITNESKSKT